MPRKAREITITTTGKPMMDDLFVQLIARALVERNQIKLAAVDGQLVEKKKPNNRS
jgi:hypothetical protein